MCNLYSLTKGQDAIRRLFRVSRDELGNLPSLPEIFPDQIAPVVRIIGGERTLVHHRWGMPCPPRYGGRPVTNIRNPWSPHWRAWLKPESRCLVPATSFCEWTDSRPKTKVWFAMGRSEPIFAFAGLWCRWTGPRGTKANPVDGEHLLFGFLTTDADDVVGPVHAKAMPLILSGEDAWSRWLEAPATEALALVSARPQRVDAEQDQQRHDSGEQG